MTQARLPSFTVIAPTSAFLDYMGDQREITLAVGTRLRWIRAGGFADPCSDIYLDWDEFEPLDGEFARLVISVEDAATPRAERAAQGWGPQWGSRPRLGPPKSISADGLIPNHIPWPAFSG